MTERIHFPEGTVGKHQECLLLKKLEFAGTGDELEKALRMAIKHVKAQRKYPRGSIRYLGDNITNDTG